MRCPYCGGLNQERAAFCVNCGRDLRRPLPNAQQQRSPSQQSGYPANQPGRRDAGTGTQVQAPRSTPVPQQTAAPASRRQAVAPEQISLAARPERFASEPEPPGPFPPRSMEQFKALLSAGVQQYTVVESSLTAAKRKLVRIAFAPCAGWQQAATLLRALQDAREEKLDTVIVQGVQTQQRDVYAFTNGQLQFDRNVLLGSQVSNRYIVETGSGFSNNSIRFVLNE